MLDTKAIGQRIRQERERLSLSRQELAELVGLSDYYVGQLERGERQMSLSVLVNLANCLHISLDYLVFGHTTYISNYIEDSSGSYEVNEDQNDKEIEKLLKRCSKKEKELIVKILKTVIPYLRK